LSLFYNYQSAGAGISKNAPKKKPFFAFMDIFLGKFWKLIELNLINTLFSLPIILAVLCFLMMENTSLSYPLVIILLLMQAVFIGPMTAATVRILRNFTLGKPTFLWTEYISRFKSNFKGGAVLGVLDVLLFSGVAAGVYVYPNLIENSGNDLLYVPFILMFSVAIVVVMMNFYAFLMLTSTNVGIRGTIKNSLALAFVAIKKNILTLVIMILIVGVFAFLTYLNFYTIFALPFLPFSQIWLVICFNSYPVIQKYVINPYYEQRGERNPELGEEESEDTVFEDKGGEEAPMVPAKKRKTKGKVIS